MLFSKTLRTIDQPYLKGKGDWFENNTMDVMQGLTMKSLRKKKDLWPLFIMMGAGTVFVGVAFVRCGLFNPENNWTKTEGHMDYWKDKRHKLIDTKGLDFKNLPDKRRAPQYKDDD